MRRIFSTELMGFRRNQENLTNGASIFYNQSIRFDNRQILKWIFLLNPPAPALFIELACWVQSCRLFRAILLALGFHFAGLNMDTSKRKIWTSTPLCMVRRSCKIAGRKVYGYGGVGMIISMLTDKVNRSVAAVREVVKDCGGKMADSGSIMFKFKRARVVNINATESDKDQLVTLALDACADDVIEPSIDEDDTEEDSERYIKIVSSMDNYPVILSKLREEEITFETDNGFELLPLMAIEVDDEAMDLNKELMSKLLEP